MKKLLSKLPFINKEEELFSDAVGEYNRHLLTAIAPSQIERGDGYVKVGSNYTRTLLMLDFENVFDKRKMQQLSEISDNISYTYFIKRYNTEEVRKNFSKSIKQNNYKANSQNIDEASRADAQAQAESAKELLRGLSSGNDKIFLFHMLVHVVADSLEELNQLTNNIKGTLGSIGTINSPSTRDLQAFQSFLPLGKNHVEELTYRPMNTEAVSYTFPFHENEMFDSTGLTKGRNSASGNLVIVDVSKLLNKHEFVIGVSGVGKSTYLFQDMMKRWMFGTKIRTIDPKGEFGHIYESLGGEWIKFQLEGGSHINPFDLPVVDEKNKAQTDEINNALLDRVDQLKTMFHLIDPEMTQRQSNVIGKILLDVYAEKGITKDTDVSILEKIDFPRMQDLYEYIGSLERTDIEQYKNLKPFHDTLQNFVEGGQYGDIFNNFTDVDVNNDLVCYDLKSFWKNSYILRILFYNTLSHNTFEIMNGDMEDTHLYIDEAHVLADPNVPLAMEYLFFMMKVLRSFNCGITPATQSIKDFLSAKEPGENGRNYGEAVINQSIQKLYLPMKESELKFLEEELGDSFSDDEISTLVVKEGNQKDQAGKGIFFVGSKRVKLEVHLTEMEKRLWIDKENIEDIRM